MVSSTIFQVLDNLTDRLIALRDLASPSLDLVEDVVYGATLPLEDGDERVVLFIADPTPETPA